MIPVRPVAVIEKDALKAWLAEYGYAIEDVVEALVRVDRRPGTTGVSAWLEIEWYLRNADGNRFAGRAGDAARGTATVPLRSWPPLTPVAVPHG